MSRIVLLLLIGFCGGAYAQNFVSVGDQAAILYDAPSMKANRIFVVSPHYPLEAMVTLAHWVKVRDSKGKLLWVEKSLLGDRHYVMVTAALADIRQSAADDAPLAFQAKSGVLLEVSSAPSNGWIGVQHPDGQSGYVKASQVWGG